MAANKNANKIVYGGKTLIDLTTDTVTKETLLSGYTAHDKSGAKIIGTATAGGASGMTEKEYAYEVAKRLFISSALGSKRTYAHNYFTNNSELITDRLRESVYFMIIVDGSKIKNITFSVYINDTGSEFYSCSGKAWLDYSSEDYEGAWEEDSISNITTTPVEFSVNTHTIKEDDRMHSETYLGFSVTGFGECIVIYPKKITMQNDHVYEFASPQSYVDHYTDNNGDGRIGNYKIDNGSDYIISEFLYRVYTAMHFEGYLYDGDDADVRFHIPLMYRIRSITYKIEISPTKVEGLSIYSSAGGGLYVSDNESASSKIVTVDYSTYKEAYDTISMSPIVTNNGANCQFVKISVTDVHFNY